MGLTQTVTLEQAGSLTDAATHRELLLALDELLIARFNSRTWFAFTSDPQLPTGDVFLFGTATNLQVSAVAYDPADETPPTPTAPEVDDYDAATKVVWCSTFSAAPTLNRRTVEWQSPEEVTPSTWWLGVAKAERWLPLGLADVVVEDYEDAVEGVNTIFTWRSHWDHYGCIRIHNGNRVVLTLQFEDASQASVEIPPYGVICGRRPNFDEPFVFETTYLPLTAVDDPAKWEVQHSGQSAASLETAIGVFDELRPHCRINSEPDTDSTSRERVSFTGTTPAATDITRDWIVHRGTLLSVILDKRDGTTSITELTWNGFGSLPDATWSGHVAVDFASFSVRFTSEATAPAGAADEEWEHDLIPISTNVTGGQILSLHPDPALVSLDFSGNDRTPKFSNPLEYSDYGIGNVTWYPPREFESSYTLPILQPSAVSGGIGGIWDETLEESFPDATVVASLTVESDEWRKTNSAIIRVQEVALNLAEWGMSELPVALVNSDGATLRWVGIIGGTETADCRRFTQRQARKYQTAGELQLGIAVYDHHPQDTAIDGTTDGLGGEVGWAIQPVATSQVKIQGTPWTREDTRGRDVYAPADVLHTVLENIETANWWLDNRDDMMAGTLAEEDKLLTWRIPRLVEQFNDLARAINNVREVYPATIYDLYKDPMPARVGTEHYEAFPFYYSGEIPFAVPADWLDGRYDTSAVLQDWADLWGITLETGVPDVSTLRTTVRTIVYAAYDGPSSNETTDLRLGDAENNSAIGYSEDTINGETYNTWSAWTAEAQLVLFGGRGTDSGYKWLSVTEAESVFGPLGVPLPPRPSGEFYNPVIEPPTAITQIAGDPRPGGSTENWQADADTSYRQSAVDGTWRRVIHSSNFPFRMIDVDSTRQRVFGVGADPSWQLTETSDSLDYIFHHSTGGAASMTAWVETPIRLTPRSSAFDGAEAWPTLRRYDSEYPALLVASPEPYWEGDFDGTVEDWTIHDPDLETGLFFRECTTADMPLTVAKLKGWSNTDWDCWHCQVVPRTGVLREL